MFLLAAFAAVGVIVAMRPLLVTRLHRRRIALVLALVAVVVVCSLAGQYLFDQGGLWVRTGLPRPPAAHATGAEAKGSRRVP